MKTRARTSQSTELAPRQFGDANLPDHLRTSPRESFGNRNIQDMIVPRLKLLQGLSPEVKQSDGELVAGRWYHSVADEMLGKEIRIVPVLVQGTFAAWTPRVRGGGEPQLLFSSLDRETWDRPNEEFPVTLEGGRKVTWRTGSDVGDTRHGDLTAWGSSDPDNPKSPPAAALTYRCIFFLMDRPEPLPVMYIASRTAIQPIKELITKVEFRGVHQCGQIFKAKVVEKSKDGTSWFAPSFEADGVVEDKQLFEMLCTQGRSFDRNFKRVKASDESEEGGEERRERANKTY